VKAAALAKLLELETLGLGLLVLRLEIVPALALGALQDDVVARHKNLSGIRGQGSGIRVGESLP
jgi:hypothetical protein